MDSPSLDNLSEFFKLFEFRKIVMLLLGYFIISSLANYIYKISESVQQRFASKRLLILKVTTVLSFTLYILGTIFLFYSVLKPPKELLIAIGGSAAVAIGFALKDIVASIMAGLILLFDRPFQVGDRVQFGDNYGEISKIGLRAVRMTTLDDSLVTIPNSKFVTEAVSSSNAGALDMMIVSSFHLSLDSDLRVARETIREVVSTSRYAYLKKPVYVVFEEKNSGELFYIEMKVKAYVLDVKYEKAFQTDIIMRGNESLKEKSTLRPALSRA